MLSIIAKWSIAPGCEQQAVAALGELAQSVRDYGSHNEIDFTAAGPKQPYFPYQFGNWVTMPGGEYFFVPSLSFLRGTTT